MSDKMNEAIQDIAVKHGVFLSKDDPVLILHTMNEKLLEENRKTQQEMLAQVKEEMACISSEWKEDAKEKAEKVLNVALVSSKDAMARLMLESARESIEAMKKFLSDSLVEVQTLTQQSQKFSRFAWVSSAALFVASCMVLLLVCK
ncbi:TPA: conjugal transfer protein TraM [Legionella pneumophila]|uniref:conjugal transfer protein TraM n=1 Tax=Legionella pneumophila TaxID=446 RepID=UPI000777F841|nr:conjugal transfer protein TraM [Legionella pneumophila]HAT8648945.1 conjugal transfer protein TraM [Legionella pneumophila]